MDDRPLTDRQEEVLQAYLENECNTRKTARALGQTRQSVQQTIRVIERKGAAPWLSQAPMVEHMSYGKTTVQYSGNGKVITEWKRMEPRLELLREVVDGLCEQVRGKLKVPKRRERKTDNDDVLFELDLYDAHVGLYADEKETLDKDYDCDIAAKRMVAAAEGICRRADRPGKVVVVFGGDMLHADNRSNKTEASGHVLDVDTRYSRVVDYIIRASRDVIRIAASIGAKVEIVIIEGNHSWHSEVWLARVLAAAYEGNDHVEVILKASPRKEMVFGDNLLIWAHGDKIRADKWPLIIAAEFPKQWGKTKFRYLKLGHVHHQKVIAPVQINEQAGLVVEYLPALAATDAWHSGAGYIGSQKGACGFEFHKKLGCMTRFFQPVE